MQPGLGLCQHPLLLLQRVALVAPLRIRQRQLFLQVRQFFYLLGTFLLNVGYLLLRLLQRTAICTRQIVLLQQQTRAARLHLLDVALQVLSLCLGQLQLLLQLQLLALQFVVSILRGARRLFRLRQVLPFRFGK